MISGDEAEVDVDAVGFFRAAAAARAAAFAFLIEATEGAITIPTLQSEYWPRSFAEEWSERRI